MKTDRSAMIRKWFMPYMKLHKKTVAIDLVCAAFTTAAELVLPMIVRQITNIAAENLADLTVKVIAEMAVLYIALKGVDMLAGYYMTYVGHVMGTKIERSMRDDLFAHLLRVPLSYYDSTKVGQLMSRITTDMFDVAEFAHHCPEEFFIFGLKSVIAFVVLCTINVPLTVLSFLMLPLMVWGTVYFRRKMHDAFKKRREIAGDVNSKAENSLLGVRVIKSFAREDYETGEFKKESKKLCDIQSASYKYMALLNCVVRLLDGMMYIIMIAVGGAFIMKGKITAADYTAYLLYDAVLIAAVKRIVEFIEQFEKGMTGIERFAQVMQVEAEEKGGGADKLSDVRGDISFKNVTFRYDDASGDVLEEISFDVKKGENIAIVGPSGSGKTTMCSLISRLYGVTGGQILLDGKDIADLDLHSLRQSIGMVEQDVYVFSGTVAENIIYGRPDSTREEIINAAKLAGAHEFIEKLPNGYDTYVGERGTMLSGGQKQRISIARAFLKNPPILILDEATSSLDNTSEQVIKNSLKTLAKGRTTFTIAHRLSTIRNADRIIVLTENGIEQQGTHDELIKKGGIYAELYENA